MTRKARAVYRATCAAQPAPHALPEGSTPSTLPLPRAGWAECGPQSSAQPFWLAPEWGACQDLPSPGPAGSSAWPSCNKEWVQRAG